MMKRGNFLLGLLVGAVLFGGTTAYAAGILAERSSNRIFVDGTEVQMEAYVIEGHNYMQLRDIGKAVGFNVYWDSVNRCVQIESNKPYTGEAPTAPLPEVTPKPTEESPTIYTIDTDHWSREDFSRQANDSVFTDTFDRNLYNAIRQTLVDGRQGKAAYTTVDESRYNTAKNLLSRMSGMVRYEHFVPENLGNYYAYLDFYAVNATVPENYTNAISFIQPVMAEVNRLGSGREKVIYLNDYLCTLLTYDRNAAAGIPQVFSDHGKEVPGACGAYAGAFKFLCDAADIPCMSIRSSNHAWNLVYMGGEWLHVDVTNNDASANKHNLLLSNTSLGYTDREPEMTAFLKELLVPGSTK